jgi:hypothetical protein
MRCLFLSKHIETQRSRPDGALVAETAGEQAKVHRTASAGAGADPLSLVRRRAAPLAHIASVLPLPAQLAGGDNGVDQTLN